MKRRVLYIIATLLLAAVGLSAQKNSLQTKESRIQIIADSIAINKLDSISAFPAILDSNDDNNFLEMYYYGPDMDGGYDIYDPWDIYPDRDGDSRERNSDERDSQERDTRE